jgi:phenylacetate-CoA ligase
VETQFYDTLETRDPAGREAALMSALPQIIAAAKERAPAYRRRLAGVHPEDVVDRRALAELPLTRKSELIELQRQNAPFGGLTAAPISALRRVFVSPGPIYEPEGRRPDYWRFARALFAAGFRAGDLVHNTFSYHLTPAGAMVESGAEALGCPVIPAPARPSSNCARSPICGRSDMSGRRPSSKSSSTAPRARAATFPR